MNFILTTTLALNLTCYLRVGNLDVVRNQATQGASEISVLANGWRCEGLQEDKDLITVVLANNTRDIVTIETARSIAMAEALDDITCTCSLE